LPEGFYSPPSISGLSNIRIVNHIQVFLVPLLTIFFWKGFFYKYSLLSLFMTFSFICLQYVLLFYSGGRGVLLSIVISFLLVIVFRGYKRRLSLTLCCLLPMFVGFLIYWSAYIWLPGKLTGEEFFGYVGRLGHHDAGRLDIWLAAIKTIYNNSMLGIGGQSFALVMPDFPIGSAHNMLLNVAVEYGVFAALLFLMFVAFFLYKFFREMHRGEENFFTVVFGLPILAALIYSNFTGVLLSPLGQLLFTLCFSAFFAFNKEKIFLCEKVSCSNKILSLVVVLLLFSFSLICLVITIGDVVLFSESIVDCSKASSSMVTCYPRFWLNGHYWTY